VIERATSIYPGLDARIEIHGEKGSVILEGKRVKFWEFMDKTEEDEKMRMLGKEDTSSGAKDPTKFITSEGHRLQVLDMVKAIKNDSKPLVDGVEGRKAVEIILAIYSSAKTGKVVKL
jgi:predicted dehydrogenase